MRCEDYHSISSLCIALSFIATTVRFHVLGTWVAFVHGVLNAC